MPKRHDTAGDYRYGFQGQEKDDEIKGEGNSLNFKFRGYDPRIGRFFSTDPLEFKYTSQSTYVFAANSPISLIDYLGMGPDDPQEHKVKKGETLTGISKKYGVTVEDLSLMNKLENPDFIKVGQVLKVNPEVDFTDNPHHKGYSNPNNAEGVQIESDFLVMVAADFVVGAGEENSLIVKGDALDAIKNWEPVKNNISEAIRSIKSDGLVEPGETFIGGYSPGNLKSWAKRAWDGKEKLISPVHIIGSYGFTFRVNADGQTATITVYDSKTMGSATDNQAKKNLDRPRTEKDDIDNVGANTYQRYIWEQKFE